MAFPSVTGVEVACELALWIDSSFCAVTLFSHSVLPDAQSRQLVTSRLLSAPVRTILSFQMIGEECPNKTFVCQSKLLDGPKWIGARSFAATPFASGPLKRGQSA